MKQSIVNVEMSTMSVSLLQRQCNCNIAEHLHDARKVICESKELRVCVFLIASQLSLQELYIRF